MTLSSVASYICDYLKNLGIEFSVISHDAAETLEKCAEIEKIIGGKICKNLLIKRFKKNLQHDSSGTMQVRHGVVG